MRSRRLCDTENTQQCRVVDGADCDSPSGAYPREMDRGPSRNSTYHNQLLDSLLPVIKKETSVSVIKKEISVRDKCKKTRVSVRNKGKCKKETSVRNNQLLDSFPTPML